MSHRTREFSFWLKGELGNGLEEEKGEERKKEEEEKREKKAKRESFEALRLGKS